MSFAAAVESWLGPVEPEIAAELERASEPLTLAPGADLLREGDAAQSCFLVLTGRLRSAARGFGPGDCIGCAELLSSTSHHSTISALRESRLARIPASAVEPLFARFPKAALGLARSLARHAPAPLEPSHWALVLLGASPRLTEAAAKLVSALERHGRTLHVTRGKRPELDAAWLEARAREHRHVVLELDPEPSAWSHLALRHADHVVLLAEAGASPAAGPTETALFPSGAAPGQRTLVLVHPDRRRRPTGTSRWLSARRVTSHLHVAADTPADFERAARVLTGRSVAVALSGGGARGFAHIGAIRALREAGIPIDAFGGTSTGAAMGAQAALGLGFDEMLELNRRIFSLKPFREVTLPVFSLISGDRVDRGLREAYGDVDLEDLWIPHLAVSASLSSAKLYVHERGPVWRAVRASCSLPGVAVPVLEDGQLLVDGGLINNLPVDLLRERGAGHVIAFNASGTGGALGGPPSTSFPSPWQAVWQRLRPGAGASDAPLPGILDILMRSVQLASDGHAREMGELADFHIRFAVERFGLFDVERMREIALAGYEHARPHVAGWKVGG